MTQLYLWLLAKGWSVPTGQQASCFMLGADVFILPVGMEIGAKGRWHAYGKVTAKPLGPLRFQRSGALTIGALTPSPAFFRGSPWL
jgi:hypothetical protein